MNAIVSWVGGRVIVPAYSDPTSVNVLAMSLTERDNIEYKSIKRGRH